MGCINFAEGDFEEIDRVKLDTALQDSTWEYDEEHLLLRLRKELRQDLGLYEIRLRDMTTSAAVLDWIAQISNKAWGGPKL